jgi:hypothetical protein
MRQLRRRMIVRRLPRFVLLGLIFSVLSLPGLALASQLATPHTLTDSLSVALSPSADNTLYEDPNGSLSNGAGAHFFAGRPSTDGRSDEFNQIDVASSLPPTAAIVGATLYLTMSEQSQDHDSCASSCDLPGVKEVQLRQAIGIGALAAAGVPPGPPVWLSGGRCPVVTSSQQQCHTAVAGIGSYSWSAPGMVSDVQTWLDAPPTNDGWLLLEMDHIDHRQTLRYKRNLIKLPPVVSRHVSAASV